jgi:hypothetical protein
MQKKKRAHALMLNDEVDEDLFADYGVVAATSAVFRACYDGEVHAETAFHKAADGSLEKLQAKVRF